jgi:hypothetical protein
MLSMLLYLIPPDSGEKITLGVTILLAFFVNSLVVSNYTPESTSDLPVIGVYYIFNIGLVSVSIAASICVLNLHFRAHKLNRVPSIIKKIFSIKSPKLPFTYHNMHKKVNKSVEDNDDDDDDNVDNDDYDTDANLYKKRVDLKHHHYHRHPHHQKQKSKKDILNELLERERQTNKSSYSYCSFQVFFFLIF